jgi:hypothetical protein
MYKDLGTYLLGAVSQGVLNQCDGDTVSKHQPRVWGGVRAQARASERCAALKSAAHAS